MRNRTSYANTIPAAARPMTKAQKDELYAQSRIKLSPLKVNSNASLKPESDSRSTETDQERTKRETESSGSSGEKQPLT